MAKPEWRLNFIKPHEQAIADAQANAILDYLIAEYGMLDLGGIEKAGKLFKQMKSQLEKER